MIRIHLRQVRRALCHGTGHDVSPATPLPFVPRTGAGFLLFRARPHDPGSRPAPALSGAGPLPVVIRPHAAY